MRTDSLGNINAYTEYYPVFDCQNSNNYRTDVLPLFNTEINPYQKNNKIRIFKCTFVDQIHFSFVYRKYITLQNSAFVIINGKNKIWQLSKFVTIIVPSFLQKVDKKFINVRIIQIL